LTFVYQLLGRICEWIKIKEPILVGLELVWFFERGLGNGPLSLLFEEL
jgi:hypothetical protein